MNIQYQTPNEVSLIGEAALQVQSVTSGGTVLASVSGAIYLQSQQGELIWLIPMTAPMHQRGLKIAAQLPQVGTGDKFQVVDHTLLINSEAIIDFNQSPLWREPKIIIGDIIPRSRLPGILNLAAGKLLAIYPPEGLGCLLSPILELILQQQESPPTQLVSIESPITRVAWHEIKGMLQAFRRNDTPLFIQHAKSLVGLGEGLTPSGDDFLGGFFYALRLLQDHYSEEAKLEFSNYSDFIIQSKPLTSTLSYTILLDHAGGHSVEPLHLLGNGLLMGVPPGELISHAEQLISVGHSSGWDILAGFFAGMLVVTVQ